MVAKRISRLIWIWMSILLVVVCADQGREIEGQGPVEKFRKQKEWLYVYAKANAINQDLYYQSKLSMYVAGHTLFDAVLLLW